ncbi:MAG: transporter substrate-binding domain-containing protein [Candidatus Omnitrophica bacterium]|nr:transporter substrate-binding domain-containing protein [Candidatus Omnitrophota bacterium]
MKRNIQLFIRGFLLYVSIAFFLSIAPVQAQSSPRTTTLKTIIVNNYAPYTFVDAKGQPAGFSVDLVKAVAQAMGFQVEITVDTWDHARHALASGVIDFLPMMAYSKERDKIYDFSPPHTIAYDAFFTRKGVRAIHSINDVQGKNIIVMKGDQAHDYLLSLGFIKPERFILIDSLPKALHLLSSGAGDLALMPKLVGLTLIRDLKLTNLELSPVVVEAYNRPFSFAVREDNQAVLERLNQGLSIIKSTGQYKDIYAKWFGALEPGSISGAIFFKWLGVGLVIFLIVGGLLLLWSFSLQALVTLRTRALEVEIRERKKAEEELRQSEERLKFALEGGLLGYWDWDIIRQTVQRNHIWAEMLGYTFEEIQATTQQWSDFVYPDDRAAAWRSINDCLEGKTPMHEAEYRMRTKDGGYKWILDRARVVQRDPQGRALRMTGVHTDITVRRNSADILRKAKEDAEAANKAKSEFLTNIAHDFRTPMHAILGFSELLQVEHPMDQQKKFSQIINTKAKSLLFLVEELVDISRLESGRIVLRRVDFDLKHLVITAVEDGRAELMQKEVKLTPVIQDSLPLLKGDASRFNQILTNLIGNAVKYTDRGEIIVRVERVAENFPSDKCRIRLTVKDTGLGIPHEKLSRIFDAFTRYHEFAGGQERGGVGLGLYITKTLVDLMGGGMRVVSDVGRGSEFIVTLDFDLA